MKKVAVLKNISFEGPGSFKEILEGMGYKVLEFSCFKGNFPEPKDFCAVLIMGGPMGVYEAKDYPFLEEEIGLIRMFYEQEKKILGVCLGAQLIAKAFGGEVYKGEWGKEIGWFYIYPQDKLEYLFYDKFLAFHWHGDTFEIPKNGIRIASSVMYKNQGFRIGDNVYALQFHLEMEEKDLEVWVSAYKSELEKEGIDPNSLFVESKVFSDLKKRAEMFLKMFFENGKSGYVFPASRPF